MSSGKKAVSCIPCAKRKVRCDKLQPCCHCRRRQKDDCVYPTPGIVHHGSAKGAQARRMEKLEQYIRSLGGDPNDIDQSDKSGSPVVEETLLKDREQESRGLPNGILTDLPPRTKAPGSDKMAASAGMKPILVAHDEELSYIETPMWYSWSDTNQPEQASPNTSSRMSQPPNSKTRFPSFSPTLLDPRQDLEHSFTCAQLPSASQVSLLWNTYLKNVHPMVKIFFDWETEPIIQKAIKGVSNLTNSEQALVLAIIFVATLSLSPEECVSISSNEKPQYLDKCQRASEDALILADFAMTNDILVLQAFMLYLVAMRDRARPAASHSLMGIASRIAERLGLHRDGSQLGLSVLRSEHRRRIWWQLQMMEISVVRLVGSLSLSLVADWDSAIPANLEDRDFHPAMTALPPERASLTSMSQCLWHYRILWMQRKNRALGDAQEGIAWLMSPKVPLADKDRKIDMIERQLGERFLQHCGLLDPLHIYLQIGIRAFILAARRTIRQPALVNAKVSEMSRKERDDFLAICTQGLDYYVMSQTSEALKGFRWHNENYFQWVSFVYVILEAHHRYDDAAAAADLWEVVRKVYAIHPELKTAVHRPDIASVARMTLAAWQRHDAYVQQQRGGMDGSLARETPPWIVELCQNFDLPLINSTSVTDETASLLEPIDFDFDMIDWSVWEQPYLNAGLNAN